MTVRRFRCSIPDDLASDHETMIWDDDLAEAQRDKVSDRLCFFETGLPLRGRERYRCWQVRF
ncbi:MAG: hypothetical protein VXZ63_00595, partial [Planctomycetota bacterium]|nr:hypothetical protein [Planctomycetota bacterium]